MKNIKNTTFILLGIITSIVVLADDSEQENYKVAHREWLEESTMQKKQDFMLTYFVPGFTNQIYAEELSLKANELVWTYSPRANPDPMARLPIYPTTVIEEHLNEEYRPAWEEVYSARTLYGFNKVKHPVSDYWVKTALSTIASTNSIPFLFDVYKQLLEKDFEMSMERQLEILAI